MGSALGGYGYRQYLTWVDRGSGGRWEKPEPHPLSQKRVAEGLLGRVRRDRLYALSQAAGAATLYPTCTSDYKPPQGGSWNPFRRVPPVTVSLKNGGIREFRHSEKVSIPSPKTGLRTCPALLDTSSHFLTLTLWNVHSLLVPTAPHITTKRYTIIPKWCTAELGCLPDRHGAWP